ncbi:Ig-like domain-containing protein [Nonlabens sp.]|uniref:Ig-like domain-containing protein n=1 Tax=Nonlabens sp. TaxID=1888209 RepID=UPI003F69501C
MTGNYGLKDCLLFFHLLHNDSNLRTLYEPVKKTFLNIFSLIVIAVVLVQCAKRGTPTGGPIDEDPPEILRAYPDNYSVNFKAQEIEITFNEYIKLNDLQKQLVVSPPLKNAPIITPQGGAAKKMTITITDTLETNTTYTFNFGQSIIDNNESNPYPYYRYVFSTGSYIDSLQLKGKITDALNYKADDFVNVLLYKMDSTYTDSLVFKGPPLYVLNTLDSLKTFTMENLAAGSYRMVGIKEENNDLKFNPKTDKIGFISEPVTIPSDEVHELKMYEPELDPSIKRVSHEGKSRFYVGYTGNLDSLNITPVENNLFTKTRITKLEKKDTLQFWFQPDLDRDSIFLKLEYKDFEEEKKVPLKERYQDSLLVKQLGDLSLATPLVLTASTPIESYDVSKMQLIDKDSLSIDFKASLDQFRNELTIDFPREESQRYVLETFPGAISDFYGNTVDSLSFNGSTRTAGDYGNMEITLSGGNKWPAIIQITKEDLTVVAEQTATSNTSYNFNFLNPGDYLIRVIYDRNRNGRYDPGNFLKFIQPEEVVYLPRVIDLQANWDVVETIKLN